MASLQELELDEISEWPLLPQLVVILLIMLLIQGAGYWFYLMPKQDEIALLKQEEETVKATLRIKANKVAVLPQIQAQLDELKERYDFLLRQLPVQKELASMLASVNQLGLDSSLTFTRIDWGERESQEFLYRLPLNIELTGSYHDIGDFSQAIAKLPRIINFDDVDWQRVSQESSTLHFRVRAYTYQFKQEVDDENKPLGLWLMSLLVLVGCKANQDDLTSYVAQVEREARKEVTKLKPILEFEATPYQQHKGREPFVLPKEALVQNQPLAKADCWQPVPRAKNGPLERYPLHQLRLKGVMSSGGSISALVQTPAGSVVKVKAGQYVGINNGKVTRVDDNYLLINETLPDGLGCWNQRNVKLALK